MAVELDEGTTEDLLAAADSVEGPDRFEAVRGLAVVVAVDRGRRAALVAVGGVAFRVG